MHFFQWASDDRWTQHVVSGRGLCWNYVTLNTNEDHTIEPDLENLVTTPYGSGLGSKGLKGQYRPTINRTWNRSACSRLTQ